MTVRAWVGNFVGFGHRRTNKAERVAAHIDIGNRLLNLRHVAGDAVIAGAAGFVMRVFLHCCCVRTVRRPRAMTFQAHRIRGFD